MVSEMLVEVRSNKPMIYSNVHAVCSGLFKLTVQLVQELIPVAQEGTVTFIVFLDRKKSVADLKIYVSAPKIECM